MKYFSVLFVALGGLISLGCVEIQDVKKTETHSPAPLTYDLVETNTLNKFHVLIHLPPGNSVLVRSKISSERTSQFELQAQTVNDYEDETVQAGQEYKYQSGYLYRGVFHSQQEVSVRVPFDLILKSDFEVVNDGDVARLKNIRKLFLSESGKIITNGFDVDIHAEQFESFGGSLETFREASTASSGQGGRHGGQIKLSFHEARGLLNLFLRGQNGGAGAPGANNGGGNGGPGQTGGQGGNSGDLLVGPIDQLKLEINKVVGAGGAGGQGGRGLKKVKCHFEDCIDIEMNGSPGLAGNAGQEGKVCFENEQTCN